MDLTTENLTALFKKKYKMQFCLDLIDHMAEGFSFESFAGKIRVGIRTIYEWAETYSEFGLAKDVGQGAALEYWERLYKASSTGVGLRVKDIDGELKIVKPDKTLLIFALKTRFHKIWGEKMAVAATEDDQFTLEFNNAKTSN